MANPTRFSTFVALLLFSLSLLVVQVRSQDSTTTSAPAPSQTSGGGSSSATVFPGSGNWAYIGCYNETTLLNSTGNVRALAGVTQSQDDMQVQVCLDYCRGQGFSKAGLEYTRECYCANHVNSFSAKLPESKCNLPCAANDTQICGGALALTVYDAMKADTSKGAGSKIARDAPMGSILALGIAMGTLFYLA